MRLGVKEITYLKKLKHSKRSDTFSQSHPPSPLFACSDNRDDGRISQAASRTASRFLTVSAHTLSSQGGGGVCTSPQTITNPIIITIKKKLQPRIGVARWQSSSCFPPRPRVIRCVLVLAPFGIVAEGVDNRQLFVTFAHVLAGYPSHSAKKICRPVTYSRAPAIRLPIVALEPIGRHQVRSPLPRGPSSLLHCTSLASVSFPFPFPSLSSALFSFFPPSTFFSPRDFPRHFRALTLFFLLFYSASQPVASGFLSCSLCHHR
jgi:hypothetical protein